MKVMITAGGTSEKIDDVRSITNSSTGRLGYAIGEAFLKRNENEIDKVYYLHGKRALYPADDRLRHRAIGGASNLKSEIENILKKEHIDIVIHSMAVSDYTVSRITTLESICSKGEDKVLGGNKISSDIDDLVIHMKKTPKVIKSIKEMSPETLLVGFKLLSGVTEEELIDVGYDLLKQNKCSFVLANDLEEISEQRHKGYLIHEDRTYETMETNEEIAERIVKRTMDAVKRRG